MASVASQAIMFNQRGPLSGIHRGGNLSNTNGDVTISNVSIGSAYPYRTVILVTQTNATSISTLSIGGVAIPSSQIIFANGNKQAIGWLSFPSGDTVNIGGTYTFDGNYRHLYSYTILNGIRTVFDSVEGTSSSNETLNLPGDESYLVGIGGGTTSSVSWTGLTSRDNRTSSVSSIISSASSTFVTTGTTTTVGVSSGTFLAASFR
jgi:hypothetical protein